jgi:transposase
LVIIQTDAALAIAVFAIIDGARPCSSSSSNHRHTDPKRLIHRAVIKRIFTDGGYAVRRWRSSCGAEAPKLKIVKRLDAKGFDVLPKIWIVERTCAWISSNRLSS